MLLVNVQCSGPETLVPRFCLYASLAVSLEANLTAEHNSVFLHLTYSLGFKVLLIIVPNGNG